MRQENWQQAKEIFYEALHKSAEDRNLFLAEACRDAPELLADVETLLDSYKSGYLEKPILDFYEGQSIDKPPASSRFQTGDELNHYIILQTLGSGGMGEVYLAKDKKLDRLVAVKILHKASGETAEKRLLREARSVAKLNHPNICSIYEVGETAEFPFIAMQFVGGETLDKLIRTNELSISDSVSIALQIAAALEEAHAHNIIHRDIKPTNIIIDPKKQVKVLDFSLAKKVVPEDADGNSESILSEIGVVAGTVAYMSPEQARGQEIDRRSDVWSLGVVLYEMITKRLPFAGESKNDVIAAILTKRPVQISETENRSSSELERIINRALEKDRERRYASIADFSADLVRLKNEDKLNWELKPANVTVSRLVPVSNDLNPQSTFSNFTQVTNEESEAAAPSARPAASGFQWKWPVAAVLLISILAGGAFWLFYYAGNSPKTPDTSNNIQTTPLFSVENKPDGEISGISFSPDGKYIVFGAVNDGGSSIYVRMAAGDKSVRLTDGTWNDRSPVWSPDGMRIAFLSNKDNKPGIWTMPYVGGTPSLQTEISQNNEVSKLIKWSNDSNHIFCQNGNKLGKLNLTNGQVNYFKLPDFNYAGDFAVSEDEQAVVFSYSQNKNKLLGVYSLVNLEVKQVPVTGGGKILSPAWFPNNHEIAYSSDRSGLFQIYTYDLSENKTSQVTFNNFSSTTPIVSPDETKIGYLLISSFNNN